MKYKIQEYGTDVDILIAPELAFAIPCIVTNTGIAANSEGKKIIKAGTPLYASANVFMNRQSVMKAAKSTETGSTDAVYGVARWDIDVTDGEKNATLLVDGYVDYLKLDDSVKALVSAETALNRILFIKGRVK